MARSRTSRNSDTRVHESPARDTPGALLTSFRDARIARGLSQAQLAGRLGQGQRQISDLERAAMDPRLSTIQNVARSLDLELMLVPRHLITAVESLQRAGAGPAGSRPMYALGDDDEVQRDSESRTEVGSDVGPPKVSSSPRRRRPKGRR